MFYLQIIDFITLFQRYQRVHIFYYLSMPIDNLTWQARLCIFNSSKLLFKKKTKKKQRYATIFTPSYRTLFMFILDFHFNNAS